MKVLLFTAIIATCCLSAKAALVWNDCAATGTNTAITVHSMDLSPTNVLFPGNVTVGLNLTVNRRIDQIFVDVELAKKTAFGSVKIPCIQGTNIGTCMNIDGCQIIDDILNGSTPISIDFGTQIVTLLTDAVGHKPQCPILPEQVVFTKKTLTLQPIPSNLLSTIADGNYHIKVMIKDDPTSSENVGCLEFDVGVHRTHHGGFLFN